jgi:hypothetical protein
LRAAINEDASMRIVIVIKKWWECEPAIAAMLNSNACPSGAPWPKVLNSPLQRPAGKISPFLNPRAVFSYANFQAEVWCISDLLNNVDGICQSSSSVKAALLPQIFAAQSAPDLVVAVGTASSATESPNRNGGVAIGTAIFLHDAHPHGENPLSTWGGPFDQLVSSAIPPKLFAKMASFDAASALLHFLPLKRNTSDAPVVTAGFTDVALGTLNVTNYGDYKHKDPETVGAYAVSGNSSRPVSIETTHGLIRLSCPEAPFMFLSTITDRLTYFDADVSGPPLNDAHNTAAAYNAGVTLRWMLANLDGAITASPPAPCLPPTNPLTN